MSINDENVMLKRWWAAMRDAGRIIGDNEPWMEESRLWPIGERYRIYEGESVVPSGTTEAQLDAGLVSITDFTGCWCGAQTGAEARHKYALMKDAQKKNPESIGVLFRDNRLLGKRNAPVKEPPEWAEYRAKMAANVRQSGERMAEQIRATTRNFMAINGIESRDLTRKHKAALGIGRLGNDWKGR